MEYAVLSQGRFTSTGATQTLILNPEVDYISVWNYSTSNFATGAGPASTGVQFYWQNGMNQNDAFVIQNNAGSTATLQTTAAALGVNGFTVVNSTINIPGPQNAITNITAANPPVVSAATTPSVGSIVRINSLNNQPQIAGIDFTVTAVNAGVSFTIGNISLVNSTASTAGNYVVIPYNPLYYPPARVITYISSNAAGNAVVYLSVTHGYTVGQTVRLSLPGGSRQWGQYASLNGVQGIITAINTARAGNEPNNGGVANNITLNISTAGLPAWNTFGNVPNNNLGTQSYVSSNQVPYSFAQVIPVGEGANNNIVTTPQYNSNLLDDATQNIGYTGVTLAAGVNSPAGASGNVIFWVAGQSFTVNNM
jgi:hypothetical protein